MRARTWLWLLALVPLAAPAAGGLTADGLEALLAGSERPQRVRYVEERTLAALDIPMTLKGTLHFRPPDYLRKDVESPRQARYILDGDRLVIVEGGERRTVGLDRVPALRAFAAALRATLLGDFATLRRYYRLEVSGRETGWTLRLTPRDEALARYVREVSVGGRAATIQRIEVVEQNGDRSVTRIGVP